MCFSWQCNISVLITCYLSYFRCSPIKTIFLNLWDAATSLLPALAAGIAGCRHCSVPSGFLTHAKKKMKLNLLEKTKINKQNTCQLTLRLSAGTRGRKAKTDASRRTGADSRSPLTPLLPPWCHIYHTGWGDLSKT